MKVLLTKRHEWDMGHRLGKGYASKCKHLHGHRYVAEMTFECEALDQHDMVVDFGTVKAVCGKWIDDNLDHATMVFVEDRALYEFLSCEVNRFHMVGFNTTVENIVSYLAVRLQEVVNKHPDLAQRKVTLVELRVNETPNGWATWRKQ